MSYKVICDRCGFEYKDHELTEDWEHKMVCGDCFEHRHPQDLIYPVRDQLPLPYTRPEKFDFSIEVDINCDTATFRPYNRYFESDETIVKGYVDSLVVITDDATISVICTLEVR